MNDLILDNQKDLLYLFFETDGNKYAIDVTNIQEIINLTALEYPEKLPNYTVGLLNFEPKKYSIQDNIIVIKTEETIFAIVVDKVLDIVSITDSELIIPPYITENNIIQSIYHDKNEIVSILNVYKIDNIIRENSDKYTDNNLNQLLPNLEEETKILEERSNAIATKSNNFSLTDIYTDNQYIVFSSDEHFYALNINYIKEIIKLENFECVPIPTNSHFSIKIINLRGEFITLINIRDFLNSTTDFQNKNKAIIIKYGDFKIGIVTDTICEITTIPSSKLINNKENSAIQKFFAGSYLRNEKICNILNIENILNDDSIAINDKV